MEIIDTKNNEYRYISHQCDENKHLQGLSESEIAYKKVYGDFPKLNNVTFNYDCKQYECRPNFQIDIYE